MDGLFAGTPPLEALRTLVSEAATLEEDDDKVIEIDVVSRAFFEAVVSQCDSHFELDLRAFHAA